jgi:hypothetical protein
MTNVVEEFLKATGWKKFATVDFIHYLNRKGWMIPDADAIHILNASRFIVPTSDGMWRKAK